MTNSIVKETYEAGFENGELPPHIQAALTKSLTSAWDLEEMLINHADCTTRRAVMTVQNIWLRSVGEVQKNTPPSREINIPPEDILAIFTLLNAGLKSYFPLLTEKDIELLDIATKGYLGRLALQHWTNAVPTESQ